MADATPGSERASDPFADPMTQLHSGAEDLTLAVGRDATLTLGTDSLIVLDERGLATAPSHASELDAATVLTCGLWRRRRRSSPTRAIPYYNVLWASAGPGALEVRYASAAGRGVVRVATLRFALDADADKASQGHAAGWVARLLDRAYGAAQRRKRVLLLINPIGGKGVAGRLYGREIEPVLAAANCAVDVQQTTHHGHAREIAQAMDVRKYDVVACCSGDGVPHEVINGLGDREDAARALARVAVCQLPCGSGNAMSWNLNGTDSPSLAALAVVKGLRTPLDLMSVTQGSTRLLSFLSQSVGLVAELDLATEHMRWMGDARFTVGFLERLAKKITYPAQIAVKLVTDEKAEIKRRQQAAAAIRAPDVPVSQADDDRAKSSAGEEPGATQGLPPLRFGTVNDPLPADWKVQTHPTMATLYVGNMPYVSADTNFFHAALPNDGQMDMVVMDSQLGNIKAIKVMLAAGDHTLFDLPYVPYSKVLAYRIIPEAREEEGWISIDGEKVPFEPFQVEVHPNLGTVLSKSGKSFEVPVMK